MRLIIALRGLFLFVIVVSIILILGLHMNEYLPHRISSVTQSPTNTSDSQQITKSTLDYHNQEKENIPAEKIEYLLSELFHSSRTLDQVQLSWNKLIDIWLNLLLKFVTDACDLCHPEDHQCSHSVNITRYVDYINKSFFPTNETRRPQGMGLYYNFNLQSIRSLNNSILSSDVTPCDYFHMIQLIIHVQSVLHEKAIDYFLTKGTLIGSLRHHDVIPWDTDIDIFIPYSAVFIFKNAFKQVNAFTDRIDPSENTADSGPLYRKNLVVYQYRNVHRVTSYKIFSTDSSRVSRTRYRWPKIDVFPYQQGRTHIYAHPQHKHNLGTMGFLNKTDVRPTVLRPLGPLLVPSPRNLHRSLQAMIQLGQSNLFYVCEGNSFLHRQNRVATEVWRVPCLALSSSYPFVTSYRDEPTKICTEMLVFNQQRKKILSLYKYKCDQHLPRTLEWHSDIPLNTTNKR